MLVRLIDTIHKNKIAFILGALFFVLLLAFFTKMPTVDGQLTGFNIKGSKYHKASTKIAEFFNLSDFIEVKVTPEKKGINVVIEGLKKLESDLLASFKNTRVKSIHHSQMLFVEEINTNRSAKEVINKIGGIPVLENLISKDKKSFLLILLLDTNHNFELTKFNTIIQSSYSGIKSLKSMSHFHVEDEVAKSIKKDLIILPLIILLFFFIIIFYVYRSFRAVIYIGIVIGISILPSFFFFSIFNISLNLITALSIPVVLVLSLADSIHLLTGYYQSKGEAKDRICSSMKSYILPSFLTSITTAIAFSSFLFNETENIQNFGIIIAFSVLLSFVLTYSISAFLLQYIVPKPLSKNPAHKLLVILTKNRQTISIVLIGIFLFSLPFVSKLKFNTDFSSFIPENTELSKTRDELLEDFNSQLVMSVLVDKKTNNDSQKFENDIIDIVEAIEPIGTIGSINSIKDQLIFKSSFAPLAPLIKLTRKDNPYYNKKKNAYRIEIRLSTVKDIKKVTAQIESILAKYDDYNYYVFSKALLITEIDEHVAISLLYSLFFSLGLIFLSILILTKSIISTLICMLVNLVPLSTIVLMFYFGNHDINILTAIIIVICLGLIVDDTIHVVYRKTILNKKDKELSLGIFITSIVLIGGFLSFSLSSFIPCQIFGYISASIFFVTMITDLTFLPFLLDVMQKNKEKKLSSSPLIKTNDRHS